VILSEAVMHKARAFFLVCAGIFLLALPVFGCRSSMAPRHDNAPGTVSLFGVVRYLDGSTVNRARVWTDTGATTFSDSVGHYSLTAPTAGDSLTLWGRDGYDGRYYAAIHSGSVRICVGGHGLPVDIVLDHADPI
jgi:hypothetical protein